MFRSILLGLTLVAGLAVNAQMMDPDMPMQMQDVRISMMVNQFFMPGKDGGENTGFAVDVLAALAPKFPNLNFIVTARPDLGYSKRKGNATDNGNVILDALFDNTADVVGCDLTRTSQDEAVADFIQQFVSYKLRIVANTKTGVNANTQYVMVDNEDLAYLSMSKNATLMAIYQNIMKGKPGSIVADEKAGAVKVLGGNFALITESTLIPNLLDKNPKTLQVVPNGLGGYFGLGFALQNNSPLRDPMDIAILQLIEDGSLKTLLTKYGYYNAPN